MVGLWRGLVAAIDRAGHDLELHAEAGFCGAVMGGGVDVRYDTGLLEVRRFCEENSWWNGAARKTMVVL